MAARKKPLLVTLDDAHVDKAGDVVASLKKAGLTDVEHLEAIGIVKGQAPPSKVEALRKVRGVKAVEEDAWMQLPAPDDPVQ